MNIKVSIIIPAYNVAPYIERCMDSVLSQTLREIEVIIVDDGSVDNTAEKIKAYSEKDARIKLISKENGGVTSARLTGVWEAVGEYIGFVDGDDIIEPDMYERLLNNALKYHADISHCGYQMVFPNRVDYYYNTGRLVKQDMVAGLKDLLSGSFIEPGLWNKLFHKSLFHSLLHNKLMDTTIKNNEDLLMNYYLFRESSLSVYEDWCPYHYMVRNGSATSAKVSVQKLTDPIRVLEKIESETANQPEVQEVIQPRIARQLIALSTDDMTGQQALLEVQQMARKELRNRLPEILRCPVCSKKEKLMARWTAICPWSFGVVHRMYAHVTGIDKKYLVETT